MDITPVGYAGKLNEDRRGFLYLSTLALGSLALGLPNLSLAQEPELEYSGKPNPLEKSSSSADLSTPDAAANSFCTALSKGNLEELLAMAAPDSIQSVSSPLNLLMGSPVAASNRGDEYTGIMVGLLLPTYILIGGENPEERAVRTTTAKVERVFVYPVDNVTYSRIASDPRIVEYGGVSFSSRDDGKTWGNPGTALVFANAKSSINYKTRVLCEYKTGMLISLIDIEKKWKIKSMSAVSNAWVK